MTVDVFNRIESQIAGPLRGLNKLLTSSPHITTLKLHTLRERIYPLGTWPYRTGLDVLEEVVFGCFMPTLKHADLHVPIRSQAGVINFIKRHESTLQKILLYESCMPEEQAETIMTEIERFVFELGPANPKLEIWSHVP